MGVELFGITAVTAMVIFYALERRSHRYVLAFSISCAAAALYALLIGSWPFAIVESVWCIIALRRWVLARRAEVGKN